MANAYLIRSGMTLNRVKFMQLTATPGNVFKIDYMNGVFAWGYRLNGSGKQEALPISLLK